MVKSPIKSTTTISPVWQPGENVLLGSSDVASDMTLYALYYVPCPTSVLNGTCSLDNIYDKNTGTLSLTYQTTCNPGFTISGNGTANPVCSSCVYSIVYNANGGNGNMESSAHTTGVAQVLTSNKFTRSGYGFAGWATSANGSVVYSDGESVKNLTDTCNGTVTLYAVWTKGQYKISYVLNGGTNYSGAPVVYDVTTPSITLGTPTRANSVFDGWYTDATFTTKITEITTGSTGDKTLYAKWSCNDGYHMDNDNMCVGNVINLGWNNGGVGVAPTYPTSCTYGQSFTMPAAIVADGYVFNNWAVNNKSFNATESVICNRDNLGVTSGSVTIVAMWERSQYTVTYSCGDGTGTPPASSGVIHNQPFITSANTCSRDGYSFGGWQISGTNDIKMANETFNWTYASNKTLTAQWTPCSYTVEFNANGGNGLMASSTHFYDREVALPAYTFAREGYVFAGWATSNNGSVVYRNKQVVKNLTPACNGLVTLYAVWAPAEYSVTYLCGDGAATALPVDTVWYDMSYTTHMGDLCVRDGYKFSGWMVGGTNDIKSGGESFTWTYASNKTLTAQWTPCSYTVKFNANGGSGSMQSATYIYDVSSALNKNTFVYDGYIFTGWNTLTNGTGMSYTDGQVIKNLTPICNGAVTLYAMWAQGQYKISYVLNGGANYGGAPIAYDITTPTITLGAPTRVNSVFGGWYTDATFTTKITEIPTGSIGDKTLYAKWSCMPGYDMNSSGTGCNRADAGVINIVWQNGGHGTTYIPSSNCLYGGSIFMPIEPYAPGYDFVGWSVNGQIFDQNQKLPCDVDTFGVEDGRVVATALWRPETYTISYNMDGGINPMSNPETYTAETPTITLSKPTKDGYVFKYWTNTVGKVVEKIESGSVGDIALKANWAIGTYKITYELKGGVNNTSNPDAYVFNKTPIVLKAPKRVGYTFDKWVGNYVVDNTIINNAAGDLEIVATWKPNIYTINLNKNNGYGNVVSSVKCTYDSGICELPSLSVLKRDGYVSKNKWCENADGTGNCYNAGANIDTNISETGTNITLYADWEPDVFKVELVAIDATINKTQTVYLKYATGWFKDSAAKTPIALINTNALPEKPGYEFAGYEHDGVMIVDANGELQLDSDSLGFTIYDSAANAIWEKSELKCAPGTEPDDNEEYCVPCQNRFDAMGNVAVSSWTKGCTIASCMYQGELYDLHDNECVQICPYDTYSDETGSMIWNDKTKRCERNCIEGFVRW